MASSCCGKRSVGYSRLHKQKCQHEMFNRCQYSPIHRRRPLAMQAYQYYTRNLLKHVLKIKMRLMKCVHTFTKSQRIRGTGHDAV
jgi:primosomal protein N''